MGPASKPVWLGQLELRVFFFFLQKPCLSLSPGALVLLMPRGRDGPVFQADVARSAGALDHFFFPSRSPLLSPSPGAPYI